MFVLLRTLVLCLSAVSYSLAAPWPTSVRHSTHNARSLKNGFAITTYHPKATFEVYERGIEHPLTGRAEKASYTDAGLAFLRSKLGDEVTLNSNFEAAHSSHVYATQNINGIPVANSLSSVALNAKGDIVSFSSSFVKVSSFAPLATTSKLSNDEAVAAAVKTLNGRDLGNEPTLAYLGLEDGSMALTHAVRLELRDDGHYVDAYVDAATGNVRGIIDYTSELRMRVVPITKSDPTNAYELVSDPEDKLASPLGWSTAMGKDTHATIGNNAIAFKTDLSKLTDSQTDQIPPEILNSVTPASDAASDTFDYEFDPSADPTSETNVAAAHVNVWFAANKAHDILYRYGFTEDAFNFQLEGKSGKNNDPVLISVQDASGLDNANFATLPDGTFGLMRMFLWNLTDPFRDGDFVNSVVLHEYAHGLTNRMTGGGTAKCLQTLESGGLGEGWSDAFAEWVAQSANGGHVPDFTVGEYLVNTGHGIRDFPYSNNRKVNPYTYADVKKFDESHAIGQIWSQTLHVVHAALVQTLGTADDALTNPDAENGHTAFLHLMVDALALQPCNPTFVDARLAWIQADKMRYAGKNGCNLWLAFAYMGLGVDAGDFVNSHKVPEGCMLQYTIPA